MVEIGNMKTMNVLLLEVLILFLDIRMTWGEVIKKIYTGEIKGNQSESFYANRKIIKVKETQ